MDESIEADLVTAHADALVNEEEDYHERYGTLFPGEMERLAPLFALAEQIFALFREPAQMRPEFRAELKAGLLAQAHQEQPIKKRADWRWAALGASAVTVAGVFAVAAWRGSLSNLSLSR